MTTVKVRGRKLIIDLDSPDDGEVGTKHWLSVARAGMRKKRREERKAAFLRSLKKRIMEGRDNAR